MVMTLVMLEKFVISEVENLHLRVDSICELIERLDERLTVVERQISLLILAVEDMRVEMKQFATKEDLKQFATKEDLKKFATKKDLEKFATKEDLLQFAVKEDLKQFATKEDLAQFVTKSDLEDMKNFFIKLLKPA